MNRNDKLSPHFTLGELIRSNTAERLSIDNTPPKELIPKLKRLCDEILEPVRHRYGHPFRPNSGYRSPELNRAIGGSARSQHCLAEAVDIEIVGVSNYDLAVWMKDNIQYDQIILECYRQGEPNSGWVHISLKENSADNRSKLLTYSNRTYTSGLVV